MPGWRAGIMLVLALLLGWVPLSAVAAEVLVVGGDSTHHRAVFTAMREVLARERSDHVLIYRTLDEYAAGKNPQAALLVTIGTVAAHTLAAAPRQVPLLCVLLPHSEYAALQHHELGALFIDQPLRRYLLLARLALPERKHIGVVFGPLSSALADELHDEAQRLQLEVKTAAITDARALAAALEEVTRSAGVALALPDPLVVNTDTARTLILDAYHRGVALIGYSQALAKAGALMAVHSTPEQIGREAGEMVLKALGARPPRLPPPRFPSYFSVSVNYQVARAMELRIPAEEQLVQELLRREGAR